MKSHVGVRPCVLADEPTEGLHNQPARELLLTLRESDLSMTLALSLHDQQLSWTPDTIVGSATSRRRPGLDLGANMAANRTQNSLEQ
jgi:ABC-type lipoprotein export system ATPase subunit